MRDGGKGDSPRPLGVTMDQFDTNFDRIFGKKKQQTLKDYIEEKGIDIEVVAATDEKEITITKTWEF